MPIIDLSRTIDLDQLHLAFRECRPRLLVVTDGNLDEGAGGFGLSRFISVLQGTTIHGMTPTVVARHRTPGDSQFDDIATSTFDVVFLFGWNGEGDPLATGARERLTRFMEGGGGVFATGDHEDMGAGMCGGLPRVRYMRYWSAAETPDIADPSRLTTTGPGADDVFAFEDQSDNRPQRLYANFQVPSDFLLLTPWPPFPATRVHSPHPLLRMANGAALDVYPDHPHEGECRAPTDLGTTFDLDGQTHSEWPSRFRFLGHPAPRSIATAMSYGNGFDVGPTGPKDAVAPRAFTAISAYNGQAAGVGRVVTDATWHHYVNINLDGMAPGGVPNADLVKIQRYYANLANWLMPSTVRMCLWPFRILATLLSRSIAEEIRIPEKEPLAVAELRLLGTRIAAALDADAGGSGSDLLADVVGATLDPERAAELDGEQRRLDGPALQRPVADLALTVVGAAVVGLVRSVAANGIGHEHGHDLFDQLLKESLHHAHLALKEHRVGLERDIEATDLVAGLLVG